MHVRTSTSWVESLTNFNKRSSHGQVIRDDPTIESDVQELLLDARARKEREQGASTADRIPTFFKPKPAPGSILTLVKKEARLRALQRRNALLLDNDELERLWYLLRENTSGPKREGEVSESINYDDFCKVAGFAADEFGGKCADFFKPSVFLKFQKDAYGRIAILSLFHFIMRKTSMLQTRVFLSYHDAGGSGSLTEQELEEYITQLIPAMPHLAHLEGSFRTRYIEIAARKFFFFHGRNGRVRVRDLLASPVLTELFELRQEPRDGENAAPLTGNWFSLQSAHRVYTLFLDLDEDMTGTLSQRELAQFPSNPNWQGGGLSELFVSRVFEEHVMRRRGGRGRPGEMDLRAFLDFVLAWENKKHEASIAYFMCVFDLKRQGYLASFEIYTFFREIHRMWTARGFYAELSIEDVKDEIFDMVKPQDRLRVYPADLMASKQQDVVVSILADVGGFWAYDNRESLVQQEE